MLFFQIIIGPEFMAKKTVYLAILLISIISILSIFVLLRGSILGYLTATPEIQKEIQNEDASAYLRTQGITYVNKDVVNNILERNETRVIIKLKGDSKNLNLQFKDFATRYENKKYLVGTLKKAGILKLTASLGNDVESIEMDHQLQSNLDDTIPLIGADLAWNLGLTGQGQTVCIIDTGIDYNHPNLSSQYIGGYDFLFSDSDPMDDQGHGTSVAGIVAGIAPGAKIIAVKAMDKQGIGYESDIIAGIDYCIANKDVYNISIILMAIGGGSFDGYCDSVIVTNESNYAVQQGIFVVAAAGNTNNGNMTSPACGTNVTSVGVSTKQDEISQSYSVNQLVDLVAPGVNITVPKLGGGYRLIMGSSASAAVVAGAAALVLENESLAPLELQYRLRSTGIVLSLNGLDIPRIDVNNAINNIVTNTPGEQIGNQSSGTWRYVYRTLPGCDCYDDSSCATYLGYYCGFGCEEAGYNKFCCKGSGNSCSGNDDCCGGNCHYI
jgi:subtilisin family serine protease